MERLSLIRLNVTNYAFESIKNELIGAKNAESNPNHVSHVTPDKNCLCNIRKNYRLPCRHVLALYPNDRPIPLEAIHQRWRIFYVGGKGNCTIIVLFSRNINAYTITFFFEN